MNALLTDHDLLTAAETALVLRLSRQTVWRYGTEGRLDVVRLSSHAVRYRADSVAALIAGGDSNSGDAAEADDARV